MISLIIRDILIKKGGERMDYNRLFELKQQYNDNKNKIGAMYFYTDITKHKVIPL